MPWTNVWQKSSSTLSKASIQYWHSGSEPLPCEKQVIVLRDLLQTAEMKRKYAELCKIKFTAETYTQSWFPKPESSIEEIAADLNTFYGTTEQIPVEIRELLIESKLMKPEPAEEEEEEVTPDDLLSDDAAGDCMCAERTCAASVTGIIVPYLFTAGNRSFKVESANREEFVSRNTYVSAGAPSHAKYTDCVCALGTSSTSFTAASVRNIPLNCRGLSYGHSNVRMD